MKDSRIANNLTEGVGIITTSPEFSHEVYGEKFYTFHVEMARLSNNVDVLPVMVSDRLIDVSDCVEGEFVRISGQFRSYNHYEEGSSRLVLAIFAREIEILEDYDGMDMNEIFLDGFLCKSPIYRTTPFGREITELLMAVNRPYNKSDYIPVIVWGRNARYAQELSVGSRVQIDGRVQSRIYHKQISETETVEKVAYEVSAVTIKEVE